IGADGDGGEMKGAARIADRRLDARRRRVAERDAHAGQGPAVRVANGAPHAAEDRRLERRRKEKQQGAADEPSPHRVFSSTRSILRTVKRGAEEGARAE